MFKVGVGVSQTQCMAKRSFTHNHNCVKKKNKKNQIKSSVRTDKRTQEILCRFEAASNLFLDIEVK